MPTSPQKTVTASAIFNLKQSEIDAFVWIEWFPTNKPVYDEEGNPTYEEDGTPIVEAVTLTEFLGLIMKQEMIMPKVRQVTAKLEEMYWKLNYNSKTMNQYIEDNLTVTVVIE